MEQDPKKANDLMGRVKTMIDKMYSKTYYSPSDTKNTTSATGKSLNNSIDKIIDRNNNNSGSSLSKVYARVHSNTVGDKSITDDIDGIFNNGELMDGLLTTYMDNRYIKDLDLEIDTLCKYMPELDNALTIKKDAVLSADVFSKEFMSLSNITSSKLESFTSNLKEIQREYKLSNLIETSYEAAAKYGEQFIYILPYTKAFDDIFAENTTMTINESYISQEEQMKNGKTTTLDTESNLNFKIEFNMSNRIDSIIQESNTLQSNNTIDDGLSVDNFETTDGFIDAKKDTTKVKVNGCIVRKLKRENVIPVYIDEVCLGYYYIESNEDNMFDFIDSVHDPLSKMKRTGLALQDENMNRDSMLKNISGKLSEVIDKKFINKNQDIKKEIYLILRHNAIYNDNESNEIKVTFIPPEHMEHLYFDKDEDTNRGISDLNKSMLPAKLYSCLYITSSIGVLTRSQDKRAYFVKQHIDTNISQLMLNTINQIKKSNFGMREINNMNNMLNITGRYNDYIIPESQSGDRPISFEVIPGQDIDTKPELMEELKNMAINPTEVPLELVNTSNSIDFARQLTTSNGKFARHILGRQGTVQDFISRITTTIYNYHYESNEIIEAILAPPAYLTLSNTTELMRNTRDFVDAVIETEVGQDEQNEPWVAEFRKNLMRHHLSTYINVDNIDKLKNKAKIEATRSAESEESY